MKKIKTMTCGRCGRKIPRSEPIYRICFSTDIFWNSDLIGNHTLPSVYCKECAKAIQQDLIDQRVDADG